MLIRPRRSGFTLIELMLVIVISSIVLGAVVAMVVRQQRFYRGAAAVMAARGSVRAAIDVLRSDLRAISPTDGDIYAMTSTGIDFRSGLGASVICTMNAARTTITIPPASLATNSGLTSWVQMPEVGDTLLIFDPGSLPSTSDDRWRRYTLTSAPVAGASCPNVSGFTTTASEATSGWTLAVTPALTATVATGAAIRFVRRVRYQLYQASNGQWYLGSSTCIPALATPCPALQPVSGPYLPGNGGSPGIAFAYYDRTGTVTSDPTRVARIDIVARAETAQPLGGTGFTTSGAYQDSLLATVATRN